MNRKILLVLLVVIIGGACLVLKKEKNITTASPISNTLTFEQETVLKETGNKSLGADLTPLASQTEREELSLKQSLSPEGRGLVNVTGFASIQSCEAFLWKKYQVQGLCRQAGACVCEDPKTCKVGACFVSLESIDEPKDIKSLARKVHRAFLGIEPSYILLEKIENKSCEDIMVEILNQASVKQRLNVRNPQEKLDYLARALWQRDITLEEKLEVLKKLKEQKFSEELMIKELLNHSDVIKTCRLIKK